MVQRRVLACPGDLIIVCTYIMLDQQESEKHKPTLVYFNEKKRSVTFCLIDSLFRLPDSDLKRLSEVKNPQVARLGGFFIVCNGF